MPYISRIYRIDVQVDVVEMRVWIQAVKWIKGI